MAFSLPLPAHLAAQRWKVKIRDQERLEPPHVTFIHGTRSWRLDLRRVEFMNSTPAPTEVPSELLDLVLESLPTLRARWDEMYPSNPIQGDADDE
jgi:hypothetical protein